MKLFNLKEARIKKEISQAQLADAVGVVRQTIGNIECGLALPSVKTAKAIAEVLEFDWTEFFADENAIENGDVD